MKTDHNIASGKRSNLSRRTVLKSLTAAAAAIVVPSGAERLAALVQSVPAPKGPPSPSPVRTTNPAWYGFNLLEYFSTDPDWMKYFPYKDDGLFLEDDFRWIRDWGFNWVRLPMDYRFWTGPDLFAIDEKKIEPIDRAVRARQPLPASRAGRVHFGRLGRDRDRNSCHEGEDQRLR